jgi:hypothetical protein
VASSRMIVLVVRKASNGREFRRGQRQMPKLPKGDRRHREGRSWRRNQPYVNAFRSVEGA